MIHQYIDGQMTRTGSYRDVPGAGTHPSAVWLAARGWYEAEPLPAAPEPGAVWMPASPAYELVDGVSVPRGEWASASAALRNDVEAAVAANPDLFHAALRFFSEVHALVLAGVVFPETMTFSGMIEALTSAEGVDLTTEGLKLRVLYDDVIFHCDGSMQTAYRYLPVLQVMVGEWVNGQ